MVKNAINKDSRLNILSAVSDWLKLLALTVLVAESIIIVAMQITPQSNPIAPWYPLFMLLFLVVVVIGVFVDRYLGRKTPQDELTLRSGDLLVPVNTTNLSIPKEKLDKTNIVDLDTMFIDSQRGFMFKRPKLPLWKKPEHMKQKELLTKAGLIGEPAKWEELVKFSRIDPISNMVLQSSVLFWQYGEQKTVKLTDESSTPALDEVIEHVCSLAEEEGKPLNEDQITNFRKSAMGTMREIKSQNYFLVSIYNKSLPIMRTSTIKPSLGNVFRYIISLVKKPVENLVANEKSIMWGCINYLTNVLIDDRLQDFQSHELYFLVENQRFIFSVCVFYSPQISGTAELWIELKDVLTSFKVIS